MGQPTADLIEERRENREFGDAALMVLRVVDALLGDEQQIIVDGAEAYDPEADTNAGDAPDGADPTDQQANAEAKALSERQDWLRQWADVERLLLTMLEVEEDAVKLGDGVYALSWSSSKKRPLLHVYDPGFYFPVLTDGPEGFPRRVDVAWELEQGHQRFVHRITWELGPIGGPIDKKGDPILADSGQPVAYEGDEIFTNANGVATIARRYPWLAADEDPSTVTCYMTEAVWNLSDAAGVESPDDLNLEKAKEIIRNEDGVPIDHLDLRIDFVPVVHIPNTPSRKEHFGRSLLTSVAQILDEIQATDTDLAKASSTTGSPVLSLSNSPTLTDPTTGQTVPAVTTYGPGDVLHTGENGKLDMLDTSKSLDALLKYMEFLLHRLSVNAHIPDEAIGRVRASQVPSGIALQLAFGPLQGLVRRMRLVRSEKYPLLLRFVQRLAQTGGTLEAGETPRAEVRFGSFLPADEAQIVTQTCEMLRAKAISRSTGLRMLADAGIVDIDVSEELQRLDQEDFEAALLLLEASGSEQVVFKRLGLDESLIGAPPPSKKPTPGGLPTPPAPGGPAPAPPAPAA
jgi:hypothetical protein